MSKKTGKAEIVYETADDSIIVTEYPSVRIVDAKIERHDTDGKKSYRGDVTFETVDGNITVPVIHKHSLKNMLQRAQTNWEELNDSVDANLTGEIFSGQVMDLRVATQGEKDWLMPPMSKRWSPITVESLVEPLAEIVGPGNTITVTPPNGIHGGFIRVNYPGNDIARYNVCISGGNLLGTKSLRMYAEGHVLACSNQLTGLVSQKFKPLVSVSLSERAIHTTTQTDLSSMLESVKIIGESFISQFEKAKNIKLSESNLKRIIDYYVSVGRITKRVKENHLVTALNDPAITQVPDTLFGFAMATSYLGTHSDSLKIVVRSKLNLVAGEVILMADKFDEYIEAIEIPEMTIEEPVTA